MKPLPCFLSVSATFSTEGLRFFALRLVIELIVLLVLEVIVLLLVFAVVLLLILAVIVLVVGIGEIVVLLLAHKRRLLLTDNFIDAYVTPTFVVCPYGKKIKRDMLGNALLFSL